MFRFRRTLRIAPGVRINFSKSSPSISIGPRGASVTIGKRGIYANLGIPGTGISYRTRIDSQDSSIRREYPAPRQHARGDSGLRQEELEKRSLSRARASQTAIEDRINHHKDIQFIVLDDGTLEIRNINGEHVSEDTAKLLHKHNADTIQAVLNEKAEEINGALNLILGIHHGSPAPDDSPVYEKSPFPTSAPVQEDVGSEPTPPTPPPGEKRGFLSSLFYFGPSKAQKACQIVYEQAMQDFRDNCRQWEEKKIKAADDWNKKYMAWKMESDRFESDQEERFKNYRSVLAGALHVPSVLEDMLEDALDGIDWPRETIVSFEIREKGGEAAIDVDLPEIEDLPAMTASLAANGKRLLIKKKSEKQLRIEYATHIHGIIFRVAATSFSTLPSLQSVIVSGFSQRPDRATGHPINEFLISVRISRDEIASVNFNGLEYIDPISAIEAFSPIRSMNSAHVFQPIEPL